MVDAVVGPRPVCARQDLQEVHPLLASYLSLQRSDVMGPEVACLARREGLHSEFASHLLGGEVVEVLGNILRQKSPRIIGHAHEGDPDRGPTLTSVPELLGVCVNLGWTVTSEDSFLAQP